MALTTDPRIGSVLAGYRVDELLGRGGMGVVYLAQDLSLERRVALKLLAPELSSEEGFRERFLRESRLAASIDHPNVIPVYEAGEFEGALFIAMRYVEGSDLQASARAGAARAGRAIALLSQVAEALDVAHEHGLVHRDVKPSNVLVATREAASTSTWPISASPARLAVAAPLSAATSPARPTTWPPSRSSGEPLDGRADLYALGCVLYECLTGRPPLQRDTVPATLFAHLEDDPPPASRPTPTSRGDRPGARRALSPRSPSSARRAAAADRRGPRGARHQRTPRLAPPPPPHQARPRPRSCSPSQPQPPSPPSCSPAATPPARRRPRTTNPTLALTADSLQRIDPLTNELVAAFPAGDDPVAIAAGEGSVWTASESANTVTQIDAATDA